MATSAQNKAAPKKPEPTFKFPSFATLREMAKPEEAFLYIPERKAK